MVSTAAAQMVACQFDEIPAVGNQRGPNPDWRSGVTLKALEINMDRWLTERRLEPLRMPDTNFSLAETMRLSNASFAPQHMEHQGKDLTLYWGQLHNHTDLSICARNANPPGHDLFANERDIEKLDFCALTDHGFDFDSVIWAYNGEQTRMNHDPDRFVAFLGEEWTSSANPPAEPGEPNRYGHHNLIYLDPYYNRYHDAFDGDINPRQLWDTLEGVEFVCIPHQLADWEHKGKGNPPTDWDYVDERLQPLAEIFQARGSYEYLGCPRQAAHGAPFKGYYLQDAWARGIVIGTIASPDHGGGMGTAGVWAEKLTRTSLFEAMRARHTFGTTGTKISLFFRAGQAIMGDKITAPTRPLSFELRVAAPRPVIEAVVFRNNEIVYREKPAETHCDLTWTDEKPLRDKVCWYYARIIAKDNELAWSSPIWVYPSTSSQH